MPAGSPKAKARRAPSRSQTVSSFTIVKGAMIEETYAVFAAWDFATDNRSNLDRLWADNFIGAKSHTWLIDVAKVLNRRFEPAGRDRPLLLRDFLETWLYPAFDAGAFRIRPEQLTSYLTGLPERGAITEHVWSSHTTERVAAGLLKIAVDFGLLRGSVHKEFASYHLPERAFLYLVHALIDAGIHPSKLVAAPAWRMYLRRPADVEGQDRIRPVRGQPRHERARVSC